MFRNSRLQMFAVLAIGALGGWLAASGSLRPVSRAEAAPQAVQRSPRDGSAARGGRDPPERPAGKKPNILFIMGDDIGWMQPSCYHRGLMVGETPNIDRIAAEGGMFMHYYSESSCTAGRCAFVTGMNPMRAGMLLPAVAGGHLVPATRHAVPRPIHVGPRLHDRPIRQEPPGRSPRTRCRPRTASRNSGVTSITWTRCRA